MELIQCDDADHLSEMLSTLFDLHRRRWESAGQDGSFVRRPLMQRFYESFALVAFRHGWLRIHALKIDGVVKAILYGYVYEGVFSALQGGRDPDDSSGTTDILYNFEFESCIKEKLHEYDFLGGFSAYKRHWGAEVRNGCDLLVGKRSLKNHLLFWKEIWPTGRLVKEGGPASEGRSHD